MLYTHLYIYLNYSYLSLKCVTAAVSECGEFLLATLGLGTEFDCQRYPDSRDSTVCVDLTQGKKTREVKLKQSK